MSVPPLKGGFMRSEVLLNRLDMEAALANASEEILTPYWGVVGGVTKMGVAAAIATGRGPGVVNK